MAVPALDALTRRRIRVEGTVQGVGFRPYVYRLASELSLRGFVRNDSHGVVIEVEGTDQAVDSFLSRLPAEVPPLAELERVWPEAISVVGDPLFQILESEHDGSADAPVTPDSAVCADCLRELFDQTDRRFRYPFINCTNCGPRFTIVRGVPYDRLLTTMAAFEMCEACLAEYEDPRDRRFHAQPNACPVCGPQLRLARRGGAELAVGEEAMTGAADALPGGQIVAVKGIGGFHLACLAGDASAVARLRARKHREDKPFALMALDLEAAAQLVELTEQEKRFLTAPARPIVIARRRDDAPVADEVAPRSPDLGVMLPYTPLHHLLLSEVGETLVMTSGNVSDEPIAFTDDDAMERLGAIADLFLTHNRPIQTRTDDSVLRALGRRRQPLVLRRSRGYVPGALTLPVPASRGLLACGAELKNTFCLAEGRRAWVSHHIGDLENYETLRSFTQGIDHFQRLFGVTPEVVVHDLHPEYLSTKHAMALEGVELVGIQHHHAHLAAVLAEHDERGPAVGAIFDGTGYGTDGTIWGGELLVGDLGGFDRVGHLLPVPMPGGAAAIREPWRMACSWLIAARGEFARPPKWLRGYVDAGRWEAVARLARGGLNSPVTTSAGRLFDAVACLCGLRSSVNYEGQAAIELEATVDLAEPEAYPMPQRVKGGEILLDARETILDIVRDLSAGVAVGVVAARFHNALADATTAACIRIAGRRGLDTVALGGGTFANRVLLARVSRQLRRAGLSVLVAEKLPPGDGSISFGQAAAAAAQLAA